MTNLIKSILKYHIYKFGINMNYTKYFDEIKIIYYFVISFQDIIYG